MQYMLTDWQGRQVGNIEQSYVPLVELGRRLNEKNDLVLWEVDTDMTRRVIGIVTKNEGDKVKRFMIR